MVGIFNLQFLTLWAVALDIITGFPVDCESEASLPTQENSQTINYV